MKRKSIALNYIWKNSKKYLPKIFFLVILNVISSLLFVFTAFFSGRLLDNAIDNGSGTIIVNALIVLSAIIAQFIFRKCFVCVFRRKRA